MDKTTKPYQAFVCGGLVVYIVSELKERRKNV